MSAELDKARGALAGHDAAPKCGKLSPMGVMSCARYAGHAGPCCAIEDGMGPRHLRAALAEVDRLTAALAEAEATIANERGEGDPPAPGWAFCDPWPEAARVADFGAEFRLWCNGDLVVKRTDCRPPSWRTFRRPQEGWGAVEFGPSYPTARAAMRAATLKETP